MKKQPSVHPYYSINYEIESSDFKSQILPLFLGIRYHVSNLFFLGGGAFYAYHIKSEINDIEV